VDSIVTDPPYGLGFMGKAWDALPPGEDIGRELLRVAKPGAHLVAFGGTRTYHRLACALEDAGWEIRDQLAWVYGSGFPKSLDVSKAIDKAAGHWRGRCGPVTIESQTSKGTEYERGDKGEPVTADAKTWQGWGTALKPAWEPIVLARKPFPGTVADNVLESGTGALNVDGCRIGTQSRWPANLTHDGSPEAIAGMGDAARYFYSAKASPGERNAGLEGMPSRPGTYVTGRVPGSAGQKASAYAGMTETARQNIHPTVKPLALMRWLCRLITPPGGTVLDPFLGSGSTMAAALSEGFECIGIERDPEYCALARRRVEEDAPLFNRLRVAV
jgi:site-specific DNA-methyltransferase (adenine-specific)